MPAWFAASMMVSPLSTCSDWPSISIFRVAIRSHHAALVFDVIRELFAKMFEEALHRHRRSVAERADGVAADVARHAVQQVKILLPALAVLDAVDDAVHPAGTFTAWRALAARFLEIEIRQALQRAHHAHRLVHHDHRARAEHRASLGDGI